MIQNNRSVIGRLHFSEFSCVFQLFHDRGPYRKETSPNWFLDDRDLRHERVSCILILMLLNLNHKLGTVNFEINKKIQL